eukprot:2541678-Prymnesium_polylepis.1
MLIVTVVAADVRERLSTLAVYWSVSSGSPKLFDVGTYITYFAAPTRAWPAALIGTRVDVSEAVVTSYRTPFVGRAVTRAVSVWPSAEVAHSLIQMLTSSRPVCANRLDCDGGSGTDCGIMWMVTGEPPESVVDTVAVLVNGDGAVYEYVV